MGACFCLHITYWRHTDDTKTICNVWGGSHFLCRSRLSIICIAPNSPGSSSSTVLPITVSLYASRKRGRGGWRDEVNPQQSNQNIGAHFDNKINSFSFFERKHCFLNTLMIFNFVECQLFFLDLCWKW